MTEQVLPVQLALDGFDGPAEVLLAEVAAGKRSADEIEVGEVGAQCLAWLLRAGDLDLLVAGELLRTGAQLAALKSTVLLSPTGGALEEEPSLQRSPGWDLESIRGACGWLSTRAGESFPLEVPSELVSRRISPRSPLTLAAALADIGKRQEEHRVSRLPVPAFIRLETAVSSLIRCLRSGMVLSLGRLLHGHSRQDTVIHFLAVLELVRRRQATASQSNLFADITVEWMPHVADTETGVRAG